jgi:hypothetical protein
MKHLLIALVVLGFAGCGKQKPRTKALPPGSCTITTLSEVEGMEGCDAFAWRHSGAPTDFTVEVYVQRFTAEEREAGQDVLMNRAPAEGDQVLAYSSAERSVGTPLLDEGKLIFYFPRAWLFAGTGKVIYSDKDGDRASLTFTLARLIPGEDIPQSSGSFSGPSDQVQLGPGETAVLTSGDVLVEPKQHAMAYRLSYTVKARCLQAPGS